MRKMKLASLALAGLMLAGTMMPAMAYENSTANVDATAEITAPVDIFLIMQML